MDRVDGSTGSIEGENKFLSDFSDGEFPLEELDETQSLSGGKIPRVDPAAVEVPKNVTA
jgi:hypothetical protein